MDGWIDGWTAGGLDGGMEGSESQTSTRSGSDAEPGAVSDPITATGPRRRQASTAANAASSNAAPDNTIGNLADVSLLVLVLVVEVDVGVPDAVVPTVVSAVVSVAVPGVVLADSAAAGVIWSAGAGCSGSTEGSVETSFQFTFSPLE